MIPMSKIEGEKAEIVREAMRIIRGVNSPKQRAASRENGKKGGRPIGTKKPLSEIACDCGATADSDHKSTCPRGRAWRRHQKTSNQKSSTR